MAVALLDAAGKLLRVPLNRRTLHRHGAPKAERIKGGLNLGVDAQQALARDCARRATALLAVSRHIRDGLAELLRLKVEGAAAPNRRWRRRGRTRSERLAAGRFLVAGTVPKPRPDRPSSGRKKRKLRAWRRMDAERAAGLEPRP